MMDFTKHNEEAWNKRVDTGCRWTLPASREEIARARSGEWNILLTPQKPVPREWFPPLENARILCLASGGGQQAPILAAAGARVTVYDISRKQLDQDALVAQREHLSLEICQGDMRDLGCFADGSFDLIVHPCANHCVDDVAAVWRESYRVLRKGCSLLAGFTNPILYMIDDDLAAREGVLQIRHAIPYSDLEHVQQRVLLDRLREKEVLEFGHSLEQLVGGQLAAGFVVTGFYEDSWGTGELIDRYCSSFVATRALKP